MEKICQHCGGTGFKTTRLKPGLYRFVRLGDDECEKAQSSSRSSFSDDKLKKNRKRDKSVESDHDHDTPINKPKKNQTGKKISLESDEETASQENWALDESDEEISSQKLKNNQTEEKTGGMGKSFAYSFADEEELLRESAAYAEPLVRPVWTGTFDVLHDESIYHRRMYTFNACISSKACERVRNVAAELQPMLHFEMLPSRRVWPKSFRASGPTDDGIALYFFPSLMKHESVYDSLVLEMICEDLAMRAFVQDSELLIFTSFELPSRFRKFQGKYYLWGVFRGKQASVHM